MILFPRERGWRGGREGVEAISHVNDWEAWRPLNPLSPAGHEPYMNYDPDSGVVTKCDLCGGEPMCVEACPTTALAYVAEDSMGYDKMLRSATLAAGLDAPGA